MSVHPSVGWLVGRSVGWSMVIELESVKTRISAPAHPSATGIGRVSGLVVVVVSTVVAVVIVVKVVVVASVVVSYSVVVQFHG